jgi:hypothetical protein
MGVGVLYLRYSDPYEHVLKQHAREWNELL